MKEKGQQITMHNRAGFKDQTYSTKPPSNVERSFFLYHFFQKVVYGLEFNERRNVKPAVVCLAMVDFADARGRPAFERALEEMVFPMGW